MNCIGKKITEAQNSFILKTDTRIYFTELNTIMQKKQNNHKKVIESENMTNNNKKKKRGCEGIIPRKVGNLRVLKILNKMLGKNLKLFSSFPKN